MSYRKMIETCAEDEVLAVTVFDLETQEHFDEHYTENSEINCPACLGAGKQGGYGANCVMCQTTGKVAVAIGLGYTYIAQDGKGRRLR